MDHEKRTAKVVEYLDRKNIPALLIKNPSNIFYLTGLLDIEGLLIVDRSQRRLFVPELYLQECVDTPSCKRGVDIQTYTPDVFRKFLGRYKEIAFIDTELTYSGFASLGKRHNLVPVPDLVKDMRMIKDRDEMKLIRKSMEINSKVFRQVKKIVRCGKTETETAGEILCMIRKYGGRKEAFEPIVASGTNSAYPHNKSRGTAIEKGMPVVVDAGVDFSGYKSDMTRTFFPGGTDKRFSEMYRILKEVHEKTMNFIKPGKSGKEIHGYAAELLKKKELDKYFIHGLGHGVGIDVHEKPVLNSKSADIIRKGCVFTVEPGIYIPNLGGIRIEDMVVLD
ncbi:MAG: aminopeptidase P family protein [Candidatus Omnitrophica bacterium]|nr:aminopeptidase P family protein [Candidatus Omnitrophota bacterium]